MANLGTNKTARAGHCVFWAENGAIRSYSNKDGQFRTHSVDEIEARARKLGKKTEKRSKAASRNFYFYGDEMANNANFANKLLEICAECRRQGTVEAVTGLKLEAVGTGAGAAVNAGGETLAAGTMKRKTALEKAWEAKRARDAAAKEQKP